MTLEEEANRENITVGEYLQSIWIETLRQRGVKVDPRDNTGFMAAKHYHKTRKVPAWYTQWKCKKAERERTLHV